jgi:hypothetical protein
VVNSDEHNTASDDDTVVSDGSFSTAGGISDVSLGGHYRTTSSSAPSGSSSARRIQPSRRRWRNSPAGSTLRPE